ncbi:MAG: GNAT family N-acetyltransferase [Gemmatimonadota bacterium]|nr:GNAT family N-acetyltransferase [Gemmatimonadota bacterium]
MHVIIREAGSERDAVAFAALIEEYVNWLRGRYEQEEWLVTEVLDMQALASEVQNLASTYFPPHGRVFLAELDGEACGCAAYRGREDGACEMKRVFVPERYQGKGIGRRLCNELIAAAGNDGFECMRLDTGKLMTEAIALYKSVGFNAIEPYFEYPAEVAPHFVFMERRL